MTLEDLRRAIANALHPQHFWLAMGHRVSVEYQACEEIRWELFRGHLLPAAQTRETHEFESWHLHHHPPSPAPPKAPLISIRRDLSEPKIQITRSILVHGWEAYESSPGVIGSRPAQHWNTELVGTISPRQDADIRDFCQELRIYLEAAVRGLSRLPITSLESPLPEFSLGEICYLAPDIGDAATIKPPEEKFSHDFVASHLRHPTQLEFAIRSSSRDDMPALATAMLSASRHEFNATEPVLRALVEVFNNASLTPYTGFAASIVDLLRIFSHDNACGTAAVLHTTATMLRLLCRHLTAFDLQRFHSQGANYPDAFVLDALLRLLLDLCERSPHAVLPQSSDNDAALQKKQKIRRALRQAWLLRKQFEQLRFPDAPTSLGENQRVLPAPFFRVPEEQILQPQERTLQLFVNEPAESLLRPAVDAIWQQTMAETSEPVELQEMGTALFLDRPLGVFKQPGEVDRTPLLSYEAFSRNVAETRLRDLRRFGALDSEGKLQSSLAALAELPVVGVPATQLPDDERTGVVALSDARKAADDFIFLATTRSSLLRFIEQSQLKNFALPSFSSALNGSNVQLLIRTATPATALQGQPLLSIFSRDLSKGQLEVSATLSLSPPYHPPTLYESHTIETYRAPTRWQ